MLLYYTIEVNHYNFKRFKIKYHPDDSIKRKEEQTIALKVNIINFVFKYNVYFIFLLLETARSF